MRVQTRPAPWHRRVAGAPRVREGTAWYARPDQWEWSDEEAGDPADAWVGATADAAVVPEAEAEAEARGDEERQGGDAQDRWDDDPQDGWDDDPEDDRPDQPSGQVAAPPTDPVVLLEEAHDILRTTPPLRAVLDGLVRRLAESCEADVALLRGDEEEGWHVVAGSGLRPLEVRPLPNLFGLLRHLDDASPVVIVAETDTVRGEVAGLPLSRHRSLLAVRFPRDVVTIVGRDAPFGQEDVDLAGAELRATLPLLQRGWLTERLLLGLVDWFEGDGSGGQDDWRPTERIV